MYCANVAVVCGNKSKREEKFPKFPLKELIAEFPQAA